MVRACSSERTTSTRKQENKNETAAQNKKKKEEAGDRSACGLLQGVPATWCHPRPALSLSKKREAKLGGRVLAGEPGREHNCAARAPAVAFSRLFARRWTARSIDPVVSVVHTMSGRREGARMAPVGLPSESDAHFCICLSWRAGSGSKRPISATLRPRAEGGTGRRRAEELAESCLRRGSLRCAAEGTSAGGRETGAMRAAWRQCLPVPSGAFRCLVAAGGWRGRTARRRRKAGEGSARFRAGLLPTRHTGRHERARERGRVQPHPPGRGRHSHAGKLRTNSPAVLFSAAAGREREKERVCVGWVRRGASRGDRAACGLDGPGDRRAARPEGSFARMRASRCNRARAGGHITGTSHAAEKTPAPPGRGEAVSAGEQEEQRFNVSGTEGHPAGKGLVRAARLVTTHRRPTGI